WCPTARWPWPTATSATSASWQHRVAWCSDQCSAQCSALRSVRCSVRKRLAVQLRNGLRRSSRSADLCTWSPVAAPVTHGKREEWRQAFRG
ncbi:unnamed protein product, partial [Durusdinium trenchii]